MTTLPIMPVLVERMLGDTAHLTNEELGAYLRLLLKMWLQQGHLQGDDMQRLSGADREDWPRLWPRLKPFFTAIDGGKRYEQKRLKEVLGKALERKHNLLLRSQHANAAKLAKKAPAKASSKQSNKDIDKAPNEASLPASVSSPNHNHRVETSTLTGRDVSTHDVSAAALPPREAARSPEPARGPRGSSPNLADKLNDYLTRKEGNR